MVTTTAVVSSPSPRAHNRSGGALYVHASVAVASNTITANRSPSIATASVATPPKPASTIAAISATLLGSAPPINTRLPPDHVVGVVFARSASKSKYSLA